MMNDVPTNYVKKWRVDRGLTQAELAERIDRTELSVNRIENGKQDLTGKTIKLISDVLDIPPGDIFRDPASAPLSATQVEHLQPPKHLFEAGFTDRLRKAIGSEATAAFARDIEMDPLLLERMLSGDVAPSAQALIAISQKRRVSIDWLVTGHSETPGSEEIALDDNGPLDLDLMVSLITEISEELQLLGKSLPAEPFGRLCGVVYQIVRENDVEDTSRVVGHALRLVSNNGHPQ